MILIIGLLKLLIMLLTVTLFDNHKLTIDATQVVNVRNVHKLQARSLIFPPTAPTRVQFIGGVGIPVEDLSFESVTSGYVLKAEYFLPETADVFHQKIKPQSIHRRRKSINETNSYMDINNIVFGNETSYLSQNIASKIYKRHMRQTAHNDVTNQRKNGTLYRWIFYKAIETILNNSRLNGHICMLRSICEHAAIPLNYEGGLLAEILHIVLTPSTSRDETDTSDHKEYFRAEVLGRSGIDCERVYNLCRKSPMEIISAVFET